MRSGGLQCARVDMRSFGVSADGEKPMRAILYKVIVGRGGRLSGNGDQVAARGGLQLASGGAGVGCC